MLQIVISGVIVIARVRNREVRLYYITKTIHTCNIAVVLTHIHCYIILYSKMYIILCYTMYTIL